MKKQLIPSLTLLLFVLTYCSGYGQSLIITPLTGDFFIYETFSTYKGSRVSANSMYVVTRDGVILIDTPWDTTQFQPLLDSIYKRHRQKVVMNISTHFHPDRTAGLEYYRQKGIKTYTTKHTDELSKKHGMKRAEYLFANDTVFKVGQYSFQVLYPGQGHTPDNIVIWFEREKILYGGCLIKSFEDTNLGNLGDANIKEYATTVERVQKKCRNPRHVIPGHGSWVKTTSISNTIKMAKALRQQDSQ